MECGRQGPIRRVGASKGHWLGVAEVDGRNATRELIASGYGSRIVLLSRPPGYGRTQPSVKR